MAKLCELIAQSVKCMPNAISLRSFASLFRFCYLHFACLYFCQAPRLGLWRFAVLTTNWCVMGVSWMQEQWGRVHSFRLWLGPQGCGEEVGVRTSNTRMLPSWLTCPLNAPCPCFIEEINWNGNWNLTLILYLVPRDFRAAVVLRRVPHEREPVVVPVDGLGRPRRSRGTAGNSQRQI